MIGPLASDAAQQGPPPASAPQQAAARLLGRLQSSPRDRSFLTRLAVVWLVLSALAASAVVLLDPTGDLGTGLAPLVAPRDRDEKAAAFLRYHPGPEVLVLGSSHVMKLRPGCITELTGMRAFNFAVSGARAEDHLAILRFVLDHGAPALKRLIVGVDPEAFQPHELERVLKSHALWRYAGRGASARWSALGLELLDRKVLIAGLHSIHLFGMPPPRPYSLEPDGFLRYTLLEEQTRSGTLPFGGYLRSTISGYRGMFRTFTALDPGRVAAFRELLAAARQRGIVVDAFIPPLHPELLRGLAGTPTFAARMGETEALLQSLEREGLLHRFDFGTLESFGADPREFFDGQHMMETNASRLLLKMHGKDAGCAASARLGAS